MESKSCELLSHLSQPYVICSFRMSDQPSDFTLLPKVYVSARQLSLELHELSSVFCILSIPGDNDYGKRIFFEEMLYGKLLMLWLYYRCAIFHVCVLYIERRCLVNIC